MWPQMLSLPTSNLICIFQNGKVIETSGNSSGSNMRQLEGTNVLLITHVTLDDAGEYGCRYFINIDYLLILKLNTYII